MTAEQVCQGSETLIFACSGAADVGEIADRAAREMTQQGCGKMFCLAGVGGGIEPILKKTGEAKTILAIDGCGMNCVKSTLEKAGFDHFLHLQLGTLEMTKGQTPPTEENIAKAAKAANDLLETKSVSGGH